MGCAPRSDNSMIARRRWPSETPARLVDEDCAGVWSPMIEGGRHRFDLGARVDRRRQRQSARYSAHSRFSECAAGRATADSLRKQKAQIILCHAFQREIGGSPFQRIRIMR